MSMVCPQCKNPFDQHLECSVCNGNSLYSSASRNVEGNNPAAPNQWPHTPWGRIFVGLLLAQGLYHGLRQLCTAGLLAVAEDGRDVWSTIFGLILQQGLQCVGLLAGGILAGAGQRRGVLLGAVVGVWSGVVLIVLEHLNARFHFSGVAGDPAMSLTTVTAYGQPLLLAAFGAVGGLIGNLIWKPLPTLIVPGHKEERSSAAKLSSQEGSNLFAGPVAWGRVLVGITITVSGGVWATAILDFVLRVTEGKLAIRSQLQAQLVTMEICGLAVLLGSGLAGATTLNGLKQGLAVGVGASSILLGIQLSRAGTTLEGLCFPVLSTSLLGLAGGWFGGQLFPPILGRRRKRYSTISPY